MPTQTVTKVQVPVGSDPYAITADMKKAFETARVVVPVASQAERDGLAALFPDKTLPTPFLVTRADLGQQIQVWDGAAWVSGSGVEVIDLPQVDTNWNQVARLTRTREPAGKKEFISMSLLLNRAAGGSFSIPNTSWWPVLTGLVPAGYRPPAGVPAGSVGYADGPTRGGLHAQIDSNGNLNMRGNDGNVAIQTGTSIYLSINWIRG